MGIPRIGVPLRLSAVKGADSRVRIAHQLLRRIIKLVEDAGGTPVLLDTPAGVGSHGIDALVLPGGGDLSPSLYGQHPDPSVYGVDPAQDDLDMTAARYALEVGLPILGICRGLQLLNVVYGGTLIQDLQPSTVVHRHQVKDPKPDLDSIFAWHSITTDPESRIADAYGDRAHVSSAHHQAVNIVGPGLVVTAWGEDGGIEAVEDPSRWLVGVQWHPEASSDSWQTQRQLFRALIGAAP